MGAAVISRRILKKARLLKSARSYDTKQLANELGVHPRTVQGWRKQGLNPVEMGKKPLIFMGHEVARFVEERGSADKCPLAEGEFFCTKCKLGREAVSESISTIETSRSLKYGIRKLTITGLCVECGGKVFRFGSEKLAPAPNGTGSAEAGPGRLLETSRPASNTDIEGA